MRTSKWIMLAFFFSQFAGTMYFVIITWLLYQITNDSLYTGLLVGFGFLPSLGLNLFFGVLVDRWDRKVLVILATGSSMIVMASLLLLFLFNQIEPWYIIVAHMLLQAAGSLFRPAFQALIAECFDKEQLPKLFSRSSSASIVGGLLGAATGGMIVSVTSEIGTLSLVIISYIIAFIAVLQIKYERKLRKNHHERKSVITDLLDGFVYVQRNRYLIGLFILMFTGQLVFHSSLGFLSVYTVDYLLASATIYGLLDATISIGGVTAGILGTWWWKRSKQYVALYSLCLVLVGLLIAGKASSIFLAFLGVFLIGLGTTWIRVLLQAVQQMVTASNYHGRMASFRMVCNQGSVVVSAPILGWIATTYGANMVYLTLLLPVIICIVFASFQLKQEPFKMVMTEKHSL
ncbi:MFS transporter [Gracilibacillus alcaliphilus]|uniref:MFS transporter n=1 Tax=Gracilibacillus alcaliphilus TaxID=1401441 RepID=UPI00195B1C82|nr:MFS transporter [Gracilibacillus alcaliphilus]MBM7676925.1 MFS family permease [Gracilibacillus alcaliphilus]